MNPTEDMQYLCRLCGSKTKQEERVYIFHRDGISLEINTKILNCLGIDVSENDYLPKVLCDECVNNVEHFHQFKIKSYNTTSMLQSLINQQQMTYNRETGHMGASLQSSTENHIVNFETVVCEPELNINNPIQSTSNTYINMNESYNSTFNVMPPTQIRNQTTYLNNPGNASDRYVAPTPYMLPASNNETMKPKKQYKQKVVSKNSVVARKPRSSNNKKIVNSEPIYPLKCDFCLKEFNTRSKLFVHVKAHTKRAKFGCSYCSKKFKTNSALNAHLKHHEKRYDYVCTYCGRGFINKVHFECHVRTNHTKEYPYECTNCDKKYPTKYALRDHELKTHINNRLDFACDICNKTFLNKYYLKKHTKTHFIPIEEQKKYKCTVCDVAYKNSTHLKNHMRSHTGETPYECHICKKSYKLKSGLDVHLLTHSGVKEFICDYCGKAFALKHNLEVHRLIHTGERKFKCVNCDRSFTQNSSLNRHRKSGCSGSSYNVPLIDKQ